MDSKVDSMVDSIRGGQALLSGGKRDGLDPPIFRRRAATPVRGIASADDQIQIRVDASKICRVARYDGSALTACQQRNAGVHTGR